jgi:HK97 family phage major capsid protein
MSVKSKELREKRGQIHAQAMEIMKKETITAEDRTRFDAMILEVDTLKGDIDRMERAEATELEMHQTVRPPEAQIGVIGLPEKRAAVAEFRKSLTKHGTKAIDKVRPETRVIIEELNSRYWDALKNYLRLRQGESLSADERAILNGEAQEFRDLGVATGAAGLYTVPTGFVYQLEEAMKWYGSMLQAADVFDTATGQSLPWPTDNDTTNTGEQIDENSVVSSNADMAFGQVIFGAFKYSTKMVKISIELLQDSAFDLESYVRDRFAIRLGRILNNKFTVGVGTTEPKGIVVAASSGVAAAVGSAANTGGSETGATTLGSNDFVELEHSVDVAYRRGAAYMMHDTTLKAVKEILDKYGRPLWKPGISSGDPDMINGYTFFINNDMAAIAASAKSVLFGQLKKYKIRRVKELAILKLSERFAEYAQVAFIGFARYDGNLLDAGTKPVKYLVQHS